MTLLAQFAVVGGGVANYIENVFNTWLYTGTGATQTITNGIDLVGKGGLTWIKSRSAATDHFLFDTARGALNEVNSNSSAAQISLAASLTAFNANGFSLGSAAGINTSSTTYASWSFRDQAKFFDVVTYTGTGANRTVAHNLESVPGCIMVKRTDTTGDWQVYHRSNANTQYMVLNSTAAVVTGATRWNSTTPTNTVFSLGTDATVNASGGTYVAYLFAHDAGGFGLTGTDNVISCGSYVGNGENNGPVVSLGYEPQWLMIKNISNTGGWQIIDNMRGFPAEFTSQYLRANTSDAEATSYYAYANATGFQIGINNFEVNSNGSTYIYIAIRRGPMKVPTTGTSVFSPNTNASGVTGTPITTNFPVDFQMAKPSLGGTNAIVAVDRLRGVSTTITSSGLALETSSTASESAGSFSRLWDNTGFQVASFFGSSPNVYWNFGRAPGFFDEVCYTGDGTGDRTLTSNLGGPPELCIVKARSTTSDWNVSRGSVSGTFLQTYYTTLRLNTTAAQGTGSTFFNFTGPPYASSFGVPSAFNTSAATYVAYLFATCPGVSKVGSYTGTGTTQTVNCGFTAGSRFVMIKRVDSTSDWYVWDSARGIVAGNDPYLLLNSAAAEVTSTDYIDTAATGFEITSTAPAAINANGGSYLFLAIA
jgi:hypothetical protein